MIIASLGSDLTGHQPARGLEVQHEHCRFEQAGGDPAADARLGAFDERH